jgi:glycosyltransferase involved in cell wall biosynthesis
MPEDAVPELCVMLTPRSLGGHEKALFGWLADAVRNEGLRPGIVAPTPALAQACEESGLAPFVLHWAGESVDAGLTPRLGLLAALRRWPASRPLLLAPGVLHSDAWLLLAALALRRRVWVYVPMTHSARRMSFRWAALRDATIAPWLRQVDGWITIDDAHAHRLTKQWHVPAPVYVLPNVVRLNAVPSPGHETANDMLRVAFVGRFDLHQKGLDWLVGVLRARPAWALGCHWWFQGQGPGEAALLELASALGPQHVQVRPFGPIDDALLASDVLLLPSRYEGVPLVALEAVSRGVPVVASRESDLGLLLPQASLFDFGDVAGLQAALGSLRDADARREAAAYSRLRMLVVLPPRRYHRARRNVVRALRQHAEAPR